MENLNIALIGCGMIGREHIERIQNRIRNAKVVAVCDVFEEGAKKGAEIAGAGTKVYTDFNEAINDPDVNAVVVTTPGQFHKGPVLAAIKVRCGNRLNCWNTMPIRRRTRLMSVSLAVMFCPSKIISPRA